jgi:polyhydroxybutyrate depolymerase
MAARWSLWSVACISAVVYGLYFATTARSVPFPAGTQQVSMQVAGEKRTYLLTRPDGAKPLPTVIFLHGLRGSAEKMRRTRFGEIGEREGFVTVFPDGVGGMWNVFPPGVHYPIASYGGRFGSAADTTFLKQLVGDLVARGVSDPNRIYLGGISYGGFMTLRMACVAPELFAAIGVVSASMPGPDGQDCHPTKPLPLVMINGTADPIVPYAGGRTRAGFEVWGTDRTLAFFRQLNGCGGGALRSELPQPDWSDMPPIVVNRWTICSGAPVVLYSVIGGGHRAPGGRGPGTGDGFSTAQTMWDFFRDKTAHND